jgi:hypothetical protein
LGSIASDQRSIPPASERASGKPFWRRKFAAFRAGLRLDLIEPLHEFLQRHQRPFLDLRQVVLPGQPNVEQVYFFARRQFLLQLFGADVEVAHGVRNRLCMVRRMVS